MENTKEKNEYYGFIYITTNNIDGKKYIGQKKYDKKGNWKNYLGSGIYLKRAIEKYGEENFTKEIIDKAESKQEIDEKEIYWIKYYNAVESKEFYNIAFGGDGGNTLAGYNDEQMKRHSEKQSKSKKGIINQGKNNPRAKQVICLNSMKIFNTTVEAGLFYNVSDALIQQACKNQKLHTAGEDPITHERLQWRYYSENETYEYIPYKKEIKLKKVLCLNNDIIYESAKDAENQLGISHYYITKCCNGFQKSAKGYKFIYLDDYGI